MTSCLRAILVTLTALVPSVACSHLPPLTDKPSSYRLGAGDELEIKVLGLENWSANTWFKTRRSDVADRRGTGDEPHPRPAGNEIDKKLVAGITSNNRASLQYYWTIDRTSSWVKLGCKALIPTSAG